MKEKKRKFILQTADSLFERFGLGKTAVDEIAVRARVAKGTIYNYFESKEGLLHALIIEKKAALDAAIRQSIAQLHDPIEKLKIVFRERLRFLYRTPYFAEYTRQSGQAHGDRIDVFEARDRPLIQEILDEAELGGIIDQTDKGRLMRVLVRAFVGFHIDAAQSSETERRESEADFDYLIAIIMKGLSRREG